MAAIAEAQEAFDLIKAAIDRSCAEGSTGPAFVAAEAAGLVKKEDTSDVAVTRFNFEKSWLDGTRLHMRFESRDRSVTFQVRPDRNSFDLSLHAPPIRHRNSYESQ